MPKVVVSKPRPSTEFYAPDGSIWAGGWWENLTPPTTRPEAIIADSLLTQVSQQERGGKQSCMLTAQLNALVVRGKIGIDAARDVQDKLVTDPAYARHWRFLGDSGYVGWTEDPATLAFFVREELGVTVGLEHIVADSADRVSQRLHEGYAAVLMGRSAVGAHARLAFEPREQEGQIVIHDQKYPETTGLYPYSAIPQFQTAVMAAVF